VIETGAALGRESRQTAIEIVEGLQARVCDAVEALEAATAARQSRSYTTIGAAMKRKAVSAAGALRAC
jgi:hypothetical protein